MITNGILVSMNRGLDYTLSFKRTTIKTLHLKFWNTYGRQIITTLRNPLLNLSWQKFVLKIGVFNILFHLLLLFSFS
jgi:hypothetical protein